ncbi:MAG: Fic family protein [Verrucomicrobia bacterium]|nr:Fic family protein [Verrucomicrobiota bacterium]
MVTNYLSSFSIAAGAITTAYGAYSYCTAKGKHRNKQKETAWKVMGVGVALMAAGGAIHYFGKTQPVAITPQPPAIENDTLTPDYLKPYVDAIKGKDVPGVGEPLKQFPPYLAKFPHPGTLANPDGGMCIIDEMDQLPPLEECEEKLRLVVRHIRQEMPEVYAAGTAHRPRWYKGYELKTFQPSGYNHLSFGMDKALVEGYGNGLKAVEKSFLQNPNLENASDKEIVDSIKGVHRTLTANVQHREIDYPINPGVLRRNEMIIGDDKMEQSPEGLEKKLKEIGGTVADLANLKSWLAKGQKYGNFELAKHYVTPEETATMKKLVYMPMDSEKVPAAMKDLARKIKEIYSLIKNQLVHPVPAAAYVHQQCGDIHPFNDFNGRVCRPLMNAVLQWGGIKGIIFPSEERYTEAVVQDQKGIRSFAEYLIDIINWNAEQKAFN